MDDIALSAAGTRAPVSFDDEPLICVDAQNNVVGYQSKAACHDGDGLLHRALSVFVFNGRGEVLLQQRSASKRLWPLWWANACCSHPRRGEQVQAAAQRRLREELGLVAELCYTHDFIYRARFGAAGSEYELCSVFVAVTDAAASAHPDEIAALRWLRPEALDGQLADAQAPYTPWLRLEWRALRQDHWPRVLSQLASGHA